MASLSGATIASTYATLIKLDANDATLVAGASGNAIQLKTGDDDTTPIYLNNDRVGIGTAAPGEELEVEASDDSTIKIESTGANSRAMLMLNNDAQQWVVDVEGAVTDNFRIRNGTTGSTKFSIMPAGNIGIGTAAPDHPLEISHSDTTAINASNIGDN